MPENARGFHWIMRLESLEFLFWTDALAIRESERFKVGGPNTEFSLTSAVALGWQRSETCGSL